MLSRRTVLVAAAVLPTGRLSASDDGFAVIEATLGPAASLGVMARASTGEKLSHRQNERFALCSTAKLPLAAAVLSSVEAGRLHLDTPLVATPADIIDGPHRIVAGPTTIERLCEAAVVYSDNSAANLLLARIGGPSALTAYMRAHRGGTTRLDRTEPTLNTNLPHDPRDTTTPAEMVSLMHALLIGDALSPPSQARLAGWMVRSSTGLKRLRAGWPAQWPAGDKTGTGERGAANDVAFVRPSGRGAILVASYVDAPAATPAQRDAAHAAVGRMVAARLA